VADLVTSAATSLLGGPQAGLIVGRAELIARLARNPLKRALRLDKIRLAALGSGDCGCMPTRTGWRRACRHCGCSRGRATRSPRWRNALLPKTRQALEGIAAVEIVETRSQIGSGALPVSLLPSAGWRWALNGGGKAAARLAAALRRLPVPVIGRIEDGRVVLDLRCLEDEAEFVRQLTILREGLSLSALQGEREGPGAERREGEVGVGDHSGIPTSPQPSPPPNGPRAAERGSIR
jgi:L-seryl-tRNA(Ser) seleniumtransferase